MTENVEARYKELLTRALSRISALEKETKASDAERADEPIAVVGAACRLPGQVRDLDSYWQLLAEGRNAIAEIGCERWPAEATYGTRCWAGLIEGADRFDAEFFGISPREAQGLDPQHRLLLTVSWEALQHAAIAPHELRGHSVGVFVGIMNTDYIHRLLTRDAAPAQDVYTVTGNGHCFAAGRIAYHLGVRGPALAVDTACSSSLVAIHLAAEAIRRGECELALASGVSVISNPDAMVLMAKTGAYSPSGTCRPFDARANGYVRGEGCGAVVLKKLSAAQRDGDEVLCLIRASGVNHDGHSSGLTVPCGESQVELLKRVQATARVSADSIGYIEAHGTGTSLGDPIEFDAIKDSFGASAESPCCIGSVKGNIGHLEGAAGIAGFLKALLCVREGRVPPLHQLQELNPRLDADGTRFEFPRELRDWPIQSGPRRAAVSSFGLSGTNAHVIVEQAGARVPLAMPERGPEVLVLSAQSAPALQELAQRMAPALAGKRLRDLGSALSLGRAHHEQRAAIVASDPEQLTSALTALAHGEQHTALRSGRPLAEQRIHFVFSGHGSQWRGMACALREREPVFAKAFSCALSAIAARVSWSPEQMLLLPQEDQRFECVEIVQPLLFAYQVALAALLQHWGLRPHALVGASMGEVAAAHVSGQLSLEDAVRVICKRSELAAETAGAMLVIRAGKEAVMRELSGFEGRVGLAAINAADNTVVSGEQECLQQILGLFEQRGVQVRWVKVGFGGHSPQVAKQADRLVQELAGIAPQPAQIPMYSTVTGALLGADERLDAAYWGRNLQKTVLFEPAVSALASEGAACFIELSPHAILLPALDSIFAESGARASALATGARDDELAGLCGMLANAYVAGLPVRWDHVFPGPRACMRLPQPSWNEAVFWAPWHTGRRHVGAAEPAGARLDIASGHCVYEAHWSLERYPELRDHRVRGASVVPGSLFFSVALALGRELLGGACELREVSIAEPLQLPEQGDRSVQTVLERVDQDSVRFKLSSKGAESDAQWLHHLEGTLRILTEPAPAVAPRPDGEPLNISEAYDALSQSGLELGASFRNIVQLSHGGETACATLQLDDNRDAHPLVAQAVAMDAALQALAFVRGLTRGRDPFLAVGLDRLRLFGPLSGTMTVQASARPDSVTHDGLVGDVLVTSESGEVVAAFEGFVVRRSERSKLARDVTDGLFTVVGWDALALRHGEPRDLTGRWLVLADRRGIGQRVCSFLREAKAECICVYAADAFKQIEPDLFEVDPQKPRALLNVLEALAVDDEPLRGIVHLWGLDTPSAARRSDPEPLLLGALHTLQDALWISDQGTAELWFAGAGANSVLDGEDVDPAASALWSLLRTARAELRDFSLCSLDFELHCDTSCAELICAELVQGSARGEGQIAYRAGQRHAARLRPATLHASIHSLAGRHALVQSAAGQIDSLLWQEAPQLAPSVGEVAIEISHSGVNRRQVEHAAGLASTQRDVVGSECAGCITAVGKGVTSLRVGQRVVLLAAQHAANVVCDAAQVVLLPDELDSEAAAGLPVAFATALQAIRERAQVTNGDTVLIQGAAGGVGIAALQVARAEGANVLAAASQGKWQALRQLGVTAPLDPRSDGFVASVLERTGGRGVDVVVHTSGLDTLDASARVLAPGGRLVVALSDYAALDELALALPPDARLLRCDAPLLGSRQATTWIAEAVQAVTSGSMVALPSKRFSADDVREAYRHVLRCQHVGKVVLDHTRAATRSKLHADASYLITGGLSGLGLLTAQILADAGARHLVLCSRRGHSAEAAPVLEALRARGVAVHSAALDIGDPSALSALLDDVERTMPPVRGVFHSAAEFADALLANLDAATLRKALHAKVRGAWNLHIATQGRALDHFVLYSSIAAVFGSAGLPAYTAANGFLDGLAAHRRAHGLAALTINWGLWAAVGVGAQQDEAWNQRRAAAGFGLLDPERGREGLFRALESELSQLGIAEINWPALVRPSAAGEAPRFLEAWLHLGERARSEGPAGALAASILAAPAGEEAALCTEQLRVFAARITGRRAEDIASDVDITNLGMDSLMTVELRTMIVNATHINLAPSVLYNHPTLEKLAAYIVERVLIERVHEAQSRVREQLVDLEELTV